MNEKKRISTMNLDSIKGRCILDEDHWIWAGAVSDGWPRVHAPDYTKHEGKNVTQPGRRAVWHIITRRPIPKGWRVYGTCGEDSCLNPDHMRCGPTADWGAHMAKTGRYAGDIQRQVAGRKTGRERSVLTDQTYMEIIKSNEPANMLAVRLGILPQTVSKVRNGKMVCFSPVGGMFSQLIVANDSGRKRA